MARKPSSHSLHTQFAELFAEHLANGTRPGRSEGEPWTYAAFAAQVQSSRENDFVSARSVSNWCKGRSLPVAIEPILRAFFGVERGAASQSREALREAFKAARLAKEVERAEPDQAGASWVVEGNQVAMDRSVLPADRRAAEDPVRRQLQLAICGHANRLADRAKRLANSHIWGRMAETAEAFGAIASAEPADVLDKLGSAYAYLLQLGRYLETDARVQKDRSCADDPLDAELHGLLTDLVRTAAPWLAAIQR